MRHISYTNGQGREYVFQRILSISGFDSTSSTDITASGSGQDGETYENTYLNAKPLEVTFEIYAATEEEAEAERRNVISRLSPKSGEGLLRHSYLGLDATIKCVPDGGVMMTKKGNCIYVVRAKFRAYDPYFRDVTETSFPLRFVKDLLVFPVTFPHIFGDRVSIGKAINSGDAPAPVIIRFYGGVTSPSFCNHTTGQRIDLIGEIPSDSVLEINTEYGTKSISIIKNGVRENAFGMLSPSSELWELAVGENEIEYISEGENDDSHGEICYYNRYVGV